MTKNNFRGENQYVTIDNKYLFDNEFPLTGMINAKMSPDRYLNTSSVKY